MLKTGSELKSAREHAGLSAELIAQRTKFKSYRILALERGDFDNLPHGIYLDAIVRAYAHEVGIDPEPMVERVRVERGTRPGDLPIADEESAHFVPVKSHRREAVEPSRATVALSGLALVALLGWGTYLYEAGGAANRNIPAKVYAALTGRGRSLHVSRATRPEAPARLSTTVTLNDVTGTWRLATEVEFSSYARYEGLLLGYELQLTQDGDRVTGIGRKIFENSSGIYSRGQTPITISGIVDGDRLMLTFTERGTQRSSQGAFVLQREQDGTMRGRFTSNAANSNGRAEARRVG
jgi:hypothetical protein